MEIKYYLLILGSLIFFYAIGKIISSLFLSSSNESNYYYRAFVSLIIGLFSVITVFAILKTRFNTVFLGLIFIFFIYFFKSKHTNYNKESFRTSLFSNLVKDLILICILSLVFYIIFGALFFDTPYNRMAHGDYYYYTRLIYKMAEYGYENTILGLDPFYIHNKIGASPYHYPELWLSVIYFQIFNILPLISILIITQVIIATVLCIGIIALAQEFSNSIIIKIFGFLSLFFSGLLFFEPIPQTSSFIDFGNIYNPKFSIIALFLIWYLILFIRKSDYFYFPLLILPVINIATAPSILTALSLYFLIKAITSRKIKIFIAKFLPILTVTIFLSVFYLLQPKIPSSNLGIIDIMDVNKHDPFQILKTFAGGILIFLSIYIWFFLPFLAYIVYVKFYIKEAFESKFKDIFLFWGILFFTGLIIWNLTNPMHDSLQFHLLPVYMLTNLMIFISFIIVYNKINDFKHVIKYIFFIFWIVMITINFLQFSNKAFFRYKKITNYYSLEYLEKISMLVPKSYKSAIGVLSSPIEIRTSFNAQMNWITMPPLDNLIPNVVMVNLTADEYVILSDDLKILKRANKFINSSPFNKFSFQNDPQNVLNKDSLRLEFIKKNNIKYLIVKDQREISSILMEITKLIVFDPVSKEKFLVLNYE